MARQLPSSAIKEFKNSLNKIGARRVRVFYYRLFQEYSSKLSYVSKKILQVMGEIKDKYNQFKTWLDAQDSDKIKFLIDQDTGWNHSKSQELGNFKDTYYWFKNISDHAHVGGEFDFDSGNYTKGKDFIPFIFGDKEITFDFIKEVMLKRIDEEGPEDGEDIDGFEENAMYCGYATLDILNDCRRFWNNLDEDKLLSVAAGSYLDDYEVVLDGHRSYLFNATGISAMIFAYFYHKKGLRTGDFDEILYNSNDVDDALREFYIPDNFSIPSSDDIDRLYNQFSESKRKDQEKTFNVHLERIVDQFDGNPHFQDKVEKVKELMF